MPNGYDEPMDIIKDKPPFDVKWKFISKEFDFKVLVLLLFVVMIVMSILQKFGILEAVKLGVFLHFILVGVIVMATLKMLSMLWRVKETYGGNIGLVIVYSIAIIVILVILVTRAPTLMPSLYQAVVAP